MENKRLPRWNKWRLMPEVKEWEAVSLSLNIEPGKIKTDSEDDEAHPFNEGEEFNDRLTIFNKHASNRTHFPTPCILNMANWYQCEVRLDEFAAWCAHVGFAIPPELSALAKAAPQAAEKVEAETDPSRNGDHWTAQARVIAGECFNRDTANICRDSLDGYSNRVMEEMQKHGIVGPRGIIDNANTVKREALQAGKWWANKSK
ncbi:hypothetical protein [Sulfuricella sp.]|uniref:hypothetical protein n=1 Tax=Sulfuricella sp. TaxID=2099377 RepID=UPI002B96B3E3|nr:hypothetical protein [Sulfuricella sp.]HUX64785.1 hypothetical protein [Sulfuricella sp.]